MHHSGVFGAAKVSQMSLSKPFRTFKDSFTMLVVSVMVDFLSLGADKLIIW